MPEKDGEGGKGGSAQTTTVLAGLAALLAAVAAVAAVYGARRPMPEPVAEPPAVEADAGSECDEEMRARARQLFEDGHYDEAIVVLSTLEPDDPDLSRLRAESQREVRARILWQEACRQDSGAGVRATLCRRIDEASPYRGRACCGEATARQQARPTGPGLDGGVPPDAGWFSAADASAEGRHVSPEERRPAAEALVEARQHVIRNDQAGCIRALEGAERTSRVVLLLMNCYYRAGHLDQACRLAERYPRVAAARQFRSARCR